MASLSLKIRGFSCFLLLNVTLVTPVTGQHPGDSGSYSMEQEYLFTVFKDRRSVRQYTSTPVPREHIIKMLDIARSAPTAGNQQPWKFLVIQDREKIDALKELQIAEALRNTDNKDRGDSLRNRLNAIYSGYLSAPLFFVVLTDNGSKYPAYNIMDGTLAAGYLIIAARSMGYGTVFITDSFSKDIIREVFNIPTNLRQICFIPVGIPETWPEPPDKKPINDLVVFEQFETDPGSQEASLAKRITGINNFLELYAGNYEYNNEMVVEIVLIDNRLYMQSGESEPVELSEVKEDEFSLKEGNTRIIFSRDPDGQITGFTAVYEGASYTTTKIE